MKPQRRYLVLLVVFAIALYVIVPQLGNFKDTFKQLQHPQIPALSLAVLAAIFTYFIAAATYCLLSFRRLSYASTTLVQLASMFVNKLLPGGIGALGVNYLYLRRSKLTGSEAAAVVTLNNVLGIIGHSLLLLIVLIAFNKQVPPIHIAHVHAKSVILVLCALLVAGLGLVIFKRRTIARALKKFGHELARFRQRKIRLAVALITSMGVTLLTIGGLWFCLQAVHVSLSFVTVFIIFSIGFSAGTAVPTPGGLGGVEAGLVAGLVAYHVPSATALAGVLLYRLLTYWLGLAAGAVAFGAAQHRGLLKT